MLQQVLNTHPAIVCLHEYNLDRLIATVDQLFTIDREQTQDVRAILQSGENEADILKTASIDYPVLREVDFDSIVHGIIGASSRKSDIAVLADKKPNYHLQGEGDELYRKYGVEPISLMIIRNPLDVINSSIARRNNTLLQIDRWHIRDVHEAIDEWIMNWEYAARHLGDPNFHVLRYDDLDANFGRETERLAEILGVANQFTNLFSRTPLEERVQALTPEELAAVDHCLGPLIARWATSDLTELLASTPRILRDIPDGSTVRFQGGSEAFGVSLTGFSPVEVDWRWTFSPRATITFRVEGGHARSEAWVELELAPYFGGRPEFVLILRGAGGQQAIHVIRPQDMAAGFARCGVLLPAPDGVVELEMIMPRIKERHEEPVADTRRLGVQVRAFSARLLA